MGYRHGTHDWGGALHISISRRDHTATSETANSVNIYTLRSCLPKDDQLDPTGLCFRVWTVLWTVPIFDATSAVRLCALSTKKSAPPPCTITWATGERLKLLGA